MNIVTSLLRAATLVATIAVAMYGLGAEPLDNSQSWVTDLIISKSIGIGAVYVAYRLGKHWRNDPLLRRYIRWSSKAGQPLNPITRRGM